MRIFVALSALVLVLAAPALAADVVPVSVVVPYGDWIGAVLPYAGVILSGVALYMVRMLPPQVAAIAQLMQVESLITTAINYGKNAVEGATHDKTLSVEVANPVLREALVYILKYGPPWVASHLGEPTAIARIVFARLHLSAEASEPDFAAIAEAAVRKAAA